MPSEMKQRREKRKNGNCPQKNKITKYARWLVIVFPLLFPHRWTSRRYICMNITVGYRIESSDMSHRTIVIFITSETLGLNNNGNDNDNDNYKFDTMRYDTINAVK